MTQYRRINFLVALFRCLGFKTDAKNVEPGFVPVAFGVLLSSKMTLPLDFFIPSCPSACSFNQSWKSFKVGLLQLQRSVCVYYVYLILGRHFPMAWSRIEALDKSRL